MEKPATRKISQAPRKKFRTKRMNVEATKVYDQWRITDGLGDMYLCPDFIFELIFEATNAAGLDALAESRRRDSESYIYDRVIAWVMKRYGREEVDGLPKYLTPEEIKTAITTQSGVSENVASDIIDMAINNDAIKYVSIETGVPGKTMRHIAPGDKLRWLCQEREPYKEEELPF